jgi:putative transposase
LNDKQSLSHTSWECKYHIVWIPKYRKKTIYEELRKHLGATFKDLANQKESQILEGHLRSDHVHMLISIPPKYAVSRVVGFIKGKSAIHIARNFMGRLPASISGIEGIMYPLWAMMKQQSVSISRTRKRKIIVVIN